MALAKGHQSLGGDEVVVFTLSWVFVCLYSNNGGKDDGADVCACISTGVLWIAQIKALEDTEDEGKHNNGY